MSIHITWHPAKRARNLLEHGFDFVDATIVFDGPTLSGEDRRFRYAEQRFLTLGLLGAKPVALVHTETADEIHIISFRKATKRETARLFNGLQDGLAPHPPDDG